MKNKLHILKLTSATLVEVLIASVITAISFAIGLLIYTNILHSSSSKLKSDLSLFIDEDIYKTIKERKYKSTILEINNIEIKKEIGFYKRKEDVLLLNYKAIDSKGKLIIEKNILKYIGKQ